MQGASAHARPQRLTAALTFAQRLLLREALEAVLERRSQRMSHPRTLVPRKRTGGGAYLEACLRCDSSHAAYAAGRDCASASSRSNQDRNHTSIRRTHDQVRRDTIDERRAG
jgi:hypothetical protein